MADLIDRIKQSYAMEQANLVAAAAKSHLPLSYEAVTEDWLTEVLCADVPGARVTSIELGPVDNGSSNRRKMALTYNEAGQAAGLPEKVFCKASHDLLNRLVLAGSGAIECETFFYNALSRLTDIEVPHSRYAAYDPDTFNSMIILDDLSDTVETFCTHETPMNLARARSQVALLAKFHSYFRLEKPDMKQLLAGLTTWVNFFDKTVDNGMKEGSNAGFLAAEEVIPPALYQRFDEIWPKTLAAIDENNRLPNTLTHNDVHLKNWYVLPGDRMGLSDWQCCGTGHWGRDVAYAIGTALTVENRRLWEKDLVAYYVELMKMGGWAYISFDQAWDHYRKQFLTALTWWTVTLSPPEGYPEMQPRDITLEFIRRLSTAMHDHSTLDML
jgi:hypothetical protein